EHDLGHRRSADVARAHEADSKERRLVEGAIEAHGGYSLAVLGGALSPASSPAADSRSSPPLAASRAQRMPSPSSMDDTATRQEAQMRGERLRQQEELLVRALTTLEVAEVTYLPLLNCVDWNG